MLFIACLVGHVFLVYGMSFPFFVYNPNAWPSVGLSTDGLGYCAAPAADATMKAKYPLSNDPSLSIAPHAAADTQSCPTAIDPSWGQNGSCWWTCGATNTGTKCLRPTDVASCNGPNTIGLSFDDGPEATTLALLSYLVANNLKATFFIVGAHLVQNPNVAKQLLAAGMELGVHTWSHHPLTSQSNDVVVSELGYTIKAFQDILGITPTLFRPPQGDIDDRIRSIAQSMGLTPVIWLADSKDYTTDGHPELVASVLASFESLMTNSSFPNGAIILEHDYFQGGVDLATKNIIPFLKSKNFVLNSVGQCMGAASTSSAVPFAATPNGDPMFNNASTRIGSEWLIITALSFCTFFIL